MAAKNKFMNAMKMPAIADMFSSEADRQRESGDLVTEVPLSELHPFVNHPFEVRDDEDMQKLVDSIKENGVLTNLTVRPRAEGGYEIISGHRRFHAAQLAGLDKIKVQVRDVDDDQAIIDMVDANIQREHISPMEKARAYAMKLEAISHQGERRQETSNQVGWKLESAHEVGQQAGDSGTQVRRYVRLNSLVPDLQKKVDSGTLKFNPAVELSYLTPDEQQSFLDYAEAQDCTPSLSQAQKLKAASKEGNLTLDKLEEIMLAQKPSVAPREPVLNINVSKVAQYFPTGCTKQQMENRIFDRWRMSKHMRRSADMAEYRYYLIPDAMTRAFPEQFGKQTPTEFFDNIADLEKRYHQLREMPYNNERTWNERTRFPYARLVVGIDRQNPDGAVAIIQVRNGVNYLCDDYRGPYADRSDAQIPQMAKKLVEVIGVDRVRPHTYTQRDGYTWVQVEKDMHITEWLYAHELCSSLQFTRFLNRDGRELFQVRDGQRVIETNADGTKRLRAVKNIDVTHAYVGHYGCHIQQYAEDNFRIGCYVAPEHPQPGDNLDKLQVYQITKGGCEYRFMNYAYSKSRIHAADYSSVYIANLPADYDLDRCFQEFNAPNRPLRYHMCSLSTSDIVVTTKNGNETAYYVDSIGFKDVSHLLPELHEVEAQHQKEQVQDEPER